MTETERYEYSAELHRLKVEVRCATLKERERCKQIALAGVDGTHEKYAEACRTIAVLIDSLAVKP